MKVRKYDPIRDAYYSVDVDKLEEEILSMGFSEEEAQAKLEERKDEVIKTVAEILGEDETEIKAKYEEIARDKKVKK